MMALRAGEGKMLLRTDALGRQTVAREVYMPAGDYMAGEWQETDESAAAAIEAAMSARAEAEEEPCYTS